MTAAAARAGEALRRRTRAVVLAWTAAFAVTLAVGLAARSYDVAPLAELAVNRGFEQGLPPWVPFENSAAEQSSIAYVGRTSAAIRSTAVGRRYGIQWISAVVGPETGERYRFAARVKAGPGAVGNSVVVDLTGNAGGTDVTVLDEDEEVLDGTWQEVDVTETIDPVGLYAIDLAIFVRESRTVGETIYVDSVSFERIDPEGDVLGRASTWRGE